MELNLNYHNNICEFGIHGKIAKKNSILAIINELSNIKSKEINITFFDAKYLPENLLKSIFLLNKTIKIQIFVFNRILYSYLYKLSLNCTLLNKKSLVCQQNIIKAIGIGGSAGSLEYIKYILEKLNNTDITIFIVQHIAEDSKKTLSLILKQYTNLIVKEAQNNEIIKEKYVYIAPAGFHTEVKNGRLLLNKNPDVNFARPSIDVLFESLASYYKNNLAVVLVSGYNDDGSYSLHNLKNAGSKILIQDPKECNQNELLLNAIKTNNYDYIMPVPEISHYLKRNVIYDVESIHIKDTELNHFLSEINAIYGYDYKNYSKESILRMIKKEMKNNGIANFENFKKTIFEDYDNFESLFLTLSINVTEFFRNPEVFKFVKDNIFSYINSYTSIKIWCTACSTGEEPYSVAIMLKETGLLEKTQIYATDINPYIIEQAKNGFFSKENFKKSYKNYFEADGKFHFEDYFENLETCYQVKKEIRDSILFFEYSLLNEGIINEFDIIFCRNVLIYFNKALFDKTIRLLYNSLTHDGFLILGKGEDIVNNNDFSVYNSLQKVYKKI